MLLQRTHKLRYVIRLPSCSGVVITTDRRSVLQNRHYCESRYSIVSSLRLLDCHRYGAVQCVSLLFDPFLLLNAPKSLLYAHKFLTMAYLRLVRCLSVCPLQPYAGRRLYSERVPCSVCLCIVWLTSAAYGDWLPSGAGIRTPLNTSFGHL